MTRFGQVEFDSKRGRLRVDGRPVELDRSCAAILSVLIEQAGKDVDKDHLLEAGWPGRVVHENSLAKAIGRLRQALGEEGRALETVHGYGYRLAAEPEPAESLEAGVPRRYRRLVLGAAACAIALLGIFWLGQPLLEAQGAGEAQAVSDRPLIRGEPADAIGRVLWVDDHPGNNAVERRFLEDRKIAVYQVESTKEALALLSMYEYRAVISDMNRGDEPLAGLELVREMRRRGDATPFYLYTFVPSAAQYTLITEAGGQGAAVTPNELYTAILPLFRAGEARASR